MRKHCQQSRRNDRPFIVPVFIPHQGCPHRCVFCNQSSVTGCSPAVLDADYARKAIESFIRQAPSSRRPFRIAFYGGNFLGLSEKIVSDLLSGADRYLKTGEADSLRFSTRPDTVTLRTLSLIQAVPIDAVEIGAQSMDDEVLRLSGRGHTSDDTVKALRLLKEKGYRIGVQMMTGLPGDDEDKSMMSASRIAALAPDFIRIYPTVVLEGSALSSRFRSGGYVPMELEPCVDLVKRIYRFFTQQDIPVIRMGLQISDTDGSSPVIAGPYHPAFGHMVLSAVFLERAAEALRGVPHEDGRITLRVHPRNISRMQGLRKGNLTELKRMFALHHIILQPDPSVTTDDVRVI